MSAEGARSGMSAEGAQRNSDERRRGGVSGVR
jgi:hypothetical protein